MGTYQEAPHKGRDYTYILIAFSKIQLVVGLLSMLRSDWLSYY